MKELNKKTLLGMDITPRSEYRAHIEYLNAYIEEQAEDLKRAKADYGRWYDNYTTEVNDHYATKSELLQVKRCKEGLIEKNKSLHSEVVNLDSYIEKLKADLRKAEDKAEEQKDKYTLKSQELTELEALRDRERQAYEKRIAKLERELRMQEQAYIEIATVHDEDKNKLDALLEATGCAPYPVINIDKPIPSPTEEVVIFEVVSAADEVSPTELPGMATAEEAEAIMEGVEIPESVETDTQIVEVEAVSVEAQAVTQEEFDTAVKPLYYGDDDGAYDLGEDEPTMMQDEEAENFPEADEEPLPSSPLYEGKHTKRSKKHKK